MTQNNLANAYRNRIRGERAENIEQAIHHYQQALEVRTRQAFPVECRQTARNLGNMGFEQGNWQIARSGYSEAFLAQEILLRAASLRSSKETEISAMRNIPARLAYAQAQLHLAQQALTVLEAGRAQLMRDALERNRRDLELLDEIGQKELLERYRLAAQQVEALQQSGAYSETRAGESASARPANWQAQMEIAQAKLDDIIDDIRQIPGYETFLLSLTAEQIQAQAENAPLVYLAATSAGGLALIVTVDDIQVVWLDDLTEEALQNHVIGEEGQRSYLRVYISWRNDPYHPAKRENWKQALDDTVHWLWHVAMQSVIAELQALDYAGNQVVLIPAGLLVLLPLHAAWELDENKPRQRHYALDNFAFTYTPSAMALLHARQQAKTILPEKLLAVENPDSSLHFSQTAVQSALALFEHPKHLAQEQATFTAVKDALSSHNVLYFFTHGVARFDNSLQSGLTLADRPLTLADIFELNTEQARLAVLSACETGVPANLQLLNEVVSLPSGLMQAGVPGVVGSLWTVLEISTAILMTIFFELWREQRLPAPEALRQAQIILRDALSQRQNRDYFKDDFLEKTLHFMAPEKIAEMFNQRLQLENFAHPFYWAAFTYTGL